jgi:hypothetical protein
MKSIKFKFKKPYLTKEDKIKISLIKGLAIGISVAVVIGVYSYKIAIPRAVKNARAEENNKALAKLKKVYILNKDISQGTKITEKDLVLVDIDKTNIPSVNIASLKEIEGKVARVNIPNKSMLYSSILVKEEDVLTDDLRLQDYKHIILGEKLQKGQYVDVRIRRPDGTDDIILCKKKAIDMVEKTIWLQLSEEERQVFNAATVEADYVKGLIYTTTYVDSQNQLAAIRTYKPNSKFLKIIKENEEMVKESMQRLEEKVRQLETENQTLRSSSSNNNNYLTVPENSNNLPQGNINNVPTNETLPSKNTTNNTTIVDKKPVVIGQ